MLKESTVVKLKFNIKRIKLSYDCFSFFCFPFGVQTSLRVYIFYYYYAFMINNLRLPFNRNWQIQPAETFQNYLFAYEQIKYSKRYYLTNFISGR